MYPELLLTPDIVANNWLLATNFIHLGQLQTIPSSQAPHH
jgi:hypothetical protein